MSLLQNSNAISAGGYDINNSLRFRASASAYLNRTFGSTYTDKTKSTVSFWVKRGRLNVTNGHSIMWYNASGASGHITFAGSGAGGSLVNDCLYIGNRNATTGSGDYGLQTTQLFRDPSAWYHIMVVYDTGQATSSNRVKLYVNGTQVTAFVSTQYPSQNYQTTAFLGGNSTAHIIGYGATTGATEYFDGYLAEMHFVDGQALTPSSFGETDAVTGSWVAKKYTGTYGTNGFYLPFPQSTTTAYAGQFSGSNNLEVAQNSAFDLASTSWTVEGWYLWDGNTSDFRTLFAKRTGGTGSYQLYLQSGSSEIRFWNGTTILSSIGTMPVNNWTHIAAVHNGTTLTVYMNGISIYSNSITITNITSPFLIGFSGSGSERWTGYISNFRLVKGTAVYTQKFVPPTSALTNISGTSLLTCQNSTAIDNSSNAFSITNTGSVTFPSGNIIFNANIVTDASGNANNWQINNINYSFYGTTYDAMTDSPTLTSATVANYCTLNPLPFYNGYNVLSRGNLQFTSGNSNWMRALATFAVSSGKWYWEITANHTNSQMHGILTATSPTFDLASTNWVGYDATGYAYFSDNGTKFNNNGGVTYGATYGAGDIIGIAFDADNGKLYFSKNGTFQASGDPAAGTNAAFTGLTSGPYVPAVSVSTNTGANTCDANFGQRPFTYTPPTGFVRLNTFNLPDSTIKKGNKVMDATTYTGNGTTQTITNTGAFKPDFVWLKSRGGTYSTSFHLLFDSVRGAGKILITNTTGAEQGDPSDLLGSFNSNGFSVNNALSGASNPSANGSGTTFVGWQWQAGQGSTSSNTSGSLTSTVSVNATAGFSVVTYSGSNSNSTVGHGLGVAPKMVIIKRRNSGSDGWQTYHASLGNNKLVYLNSTQVVVSGVGTWQNTTPTSALIYLEGNNGGVCQSGGTYVAYCWAEIDGFSKFGSWTGNASTDGPFVYTGFRPKFVLFKNSSAVTVWIIFDTARNTYNFVDTQLRPNASDADNSAGSAFSMDILSNGFKLRSSDSNFNGSGNTMIYMAFAENPFKNANAR